MLHLSWICYLDPKLSTQSCHGESVICYHQHANDQNGRCSDLEIGPKYGWSLMVTLVEILELFLKIHPH